MEDLWVSLSFLSDRSIFAPSDKCPENTAIAEHIKKSVYVARAALATELNRRVADEQPTTWPEVVSLGLGVARADCGIVVFRYLWEKFVQRMSR